MKDFPAGIGYLIEGFRLIVRPEWRRYAAAPVLVSLVVLIGVVLLLALGFETWLAVLLPGGWGWLEWLLWPLFAAVIALIALFAFVHLANIVGAPFNDLLAERVREWRRGEPLPEPGWRQVLKEGPRAISNAVRALAYGLFWAVPLLLVSLIPGVNLIAPVLWVGFNSWMLAVEYADYPLGGRGLSFRRQRGVLARNRARSLGFGLATLVATSIPVVNLAAMPAAVAGATLMLDGEGVD